MNELLQEHPLVALVENYLISHEFPYKKGVGGRDAPSYTFLAADVGQPLMGRIDVGVGEKASLHVFLYLMLGVKRARMIETAALLNWINSSMYNGRFSLERNSAEVGLINWLISVDQADGTMGAPGDALSADRLENMLQAGTSFFSHFLPAITKTAVNGVDAESAWQEFSGVDFSEDDGSELPFVV